MDKPIAEPYSNHCVVDGRTWEFVNALFKRYEAPPPPSRLRDEIAVAFEWAWYAMEMEK